MQLTNNGLLREGVSPCEKVSADILPSSVLVLACVSLLVGAQIKHSTNMRGIGITKSICQYVKMEQRKQELEAAVQRAAAFMKDFYYFL